MALRVRVAKWLLIAVTAVALNAGPPSGVQRPVPVEVWTGGDDVITQNIADALRAEFTASPYFVRSGGNKPDSLIVTIPTHVNCTRKRGKCVSVEFIAEFARSDKRLISTVRGACRTNRLRSCADQIFRAAFNIVKTSPASMVP